MGRNWIGDGGGRERAGQAVPRCHVIIQGKKWKRQCGKLLDYY